MSDAKNTSTTTVDPRRFSSAPLRNRVRLELNAPVADVWALIGNFERYPEYAAGVERVSMSTDSDGRCTEYVCHFRPQEPGAPGVAHREVVRWFEPERGYASLSAEPNDFGLRSSLTLVSLESSGPSTTLVWSQYYDSPDVAPTRSAFDEALADIANRLVARFGGRITQRFVEAAR